MAPPNPSHAILPIPPCAPLPAHYWAGQAALNQATSLITGANGAARTFSRAAAQRLLDEAEAEFRLSKPWSAPCYKETQQEVNEWRSAVREAAQLARHGGGGRGGGAGAGGSGRGRGRGGGSSDGGGGGGGAQLQGDELPVVYANVPAGAFGWVGPLSEGKSGGICDGCGRLAVELKKCSRCKGVVYCR